MTVFRPVRGGSTDAGEDRTVVAVRGEQDLVTAPALGEGLRWAATLAEADLVVDLSEVTFMGAAAVTEIVAARNWLAEQSRSLTLRSLSAPARRIIEVCRLAELVDPEAEDTSAVLDATGALGTWVEVPRSDRVDRRPEPSVPGPAGTAGGDDAPTGPRPRDAAAPGGP